MAEAQSEYLSFLLRLWRVSRNVNPDPGSEVMAWRISLQDTLTEERMSFENLDELVAFLRCRMDVGSDGGLAATQSETPRNTQA